MTREPVLQSTVDVLKAASRIMHDESLRRVLTAESAAEREFVNAGLLASIYVNRYLEALAALERPTS